MGKFIRIRAGAVVGKDRQAEKLDGLMQLEEKRQKTTPVGSRWKRNLLKPELTSKCQRRREDG